MGVEPTSSAWKAEVMPLYDTRLTTHDTQIFHVTLKHMVEGGGFEPPKAEPADLQSAPFGHSGTPPKSGSRILCVRHTQLSTKNGPNPAWIWTVFKLASQYATNI